MGKTPLILAPIIVLTAWTWLAIWAGTKLGRAREASERDGIDPRWASDAQELMRDLLAPPKDDAVAADFVVLPQALKSRTHQLFASSGKSGVTPTKKRGLW